MHDGHRISIVIPAYNEAATITSVVEDFRGHAAVDEIVVVDNNCTDRTAELAVAAGARIVTETDPGYGRALMRGMRDAKGDWLVLVEADGSFSAADLDKLLCYLPDCSMVLGTRTTRQMVQQGANMDFMLRWGNVVAAKILQLLWYIPLEPRLTDVGCTYRALTRRTFEIIQPGLTESGPGFSPEMICEAMRHELRVIEIPVHYGKRTGGDSSHSGNLRQVLQTAIKMFKAIFRKRFTRRIPATTRGRHPADAVLVEDA